MRSYDVTVAALAINAPRKWTDNLLSQHDVPHVVMMRRGIARRVPHAALLRLALVRELHVRIHIGVRDALALADSLLDPARMDVHQSGHVRVTFDRTGLCREIDDRLRDALESAPTPPRGRPRARRVGSS